MCSLLKNSNKKKLEEKVQYPRCQNPKCNRKFSAAEKKSGAYLCINCAVKAANGNKHRLLKRKGSVSDFDELDEDSLVDPRRLLR